MPFYEKQYFRQVWLWLFLLMLLGYSLLPVMEDFVILAAIIYLIPQLLILVLFHQMHLVTEIDSLGISYRFFPFHQKKRALRWEEIERIELKKYSPIFDYGGWGIRGFSDDKAYNISGNVGIQLYLKNGKKILIGTQKPQEVHRTLSTLRTQNTFQYKKTI